MLRGAVLLCAPHFSRLASLHSPTSKVVWWSCWRGFAGEEVLKRLALLAFTADRISDMR